MLVTAFETYCKSVYIDQVKKKDPNIDVSHLQTKVKNAFQNLKRGNKLYNRELGINFLQHLTQEELAFTLKSFQKRHVLVHNSGIMDARYVKLTGEDSNLIGKRLAINKEEVIRLTNLLNGIVDLIETSIA